MDKNGNRQLFDSLNKPCKSKRINLFFGHLSKQTPTFQKGKQHSLDFLQVIIYNVQHIIKNYQIYEAGK
jgi:hypothetical protein